MATSKPLPVTPMQAPEQVQHSTLEVDHDRLLENNCNAAPMVGHDPQHEKIIFSTNVDKQAVINYENVGKQAVDSYDEGYNDAAGIDASNAQLELSRRTEQRKIFGLKRKTFFIALAVVFLLMVSGVISGGVGGTTSAHHRGPTATASKSIPTPTTRTLYGNTGLAAMQYTDLNGTLHKRLYYQDSSNKVRESAWDNNTAFDTAWQINAVSDAVKPGTPIAAAAGYPHAIYDYPLVRFAKSSCSVIV